MLQRVVVHAGACGDVLERAVAAVAVERVRPQRRQVQVEEAVAVVVTDGHAHAVAMRANAGAVCDVHEPQRPRSVGLDTEVVAEQTRHRLGRLPRRAFAVRCSTLHGDDIEVAVVVVVDQPDAGADDLLDPVVAPRAVPMRELEPDDGR